MLRIRSVSRKKLQFGTVSIFLVTLILSLTASSLTPFLQTKVQAAKTPKFNWVDKGTIRADDWYIGGNVGSGSDIGYGSITFKDSNPDDSNKTFTTDFVPQGTNCGGTILVVDSNDNGKGKVTSALKGAKDGECTTTSPHDTSIGSTDKAGGSVTTTPPVVGSYDAVSFNWENSQIILATGSITDQFKLGSSYTWDRAGGPDLKCPDNISSVSTDFTKGTLNSRKYQDGACVITGSKGITLGSPQNAHIEPSLTGDAKDIKKSDCENGAGAFGWMLCPLFDGVSSVSTFIFQSLIQPLLVTKPISTDTTDPRFEIWANFRIYGDIFLLLALIVVVFGQSIGGGLIDAYTAKKILPRLLMAAILINLSIYIVSLLVDITNIVGMGMSDLIASPVSQCAAGTVAGHSCWQFNISNTAGMGILSIGLIGAIIGSVSLGVAVLAVLTGGASAFIGMAFFMILPVLFSIIAVFITLIMRQGIIALLVIISPVAFALYCLPNTEQYFKKWWEALTKTLLVYPIVMVVFATSSLLSILFLQSKGITPDNITQGTTFSNKSDVIFGAVIGFALQFLPLFLIPFSFRIAGGLVGRVASLALGAGSKLNNMSAIKNRRELKQDKWMDHKSQSQDYLNSKFAAAGNTNTGLKGYAARRLASRTRTMGGRDIKDIEAERTAKEARRQDATISNGDDRNTRGLSVDMDWADKYGEAGYDYKETDNGREYRTAGGAWMKKSDVIAAHKENGSNRAAIQAAMTYELKKATAPDDIAYYKQNFGRLTTGRKTRLGTSVMSGGQAYGILQGAAYTYANTNRDLKSATVSKMSNPGDRGGLELDSAGTLKEIVNTVNGYANVQSNAAVPAALTTGVEQAIAVLSNQGAYSPDEVKNAQSVKDDAVLLVASMRSSAMSQPPNDSTTIQGSGAAGTPMQRGQPAGRELASGGTARAQEAWNNFANVVDSGFGVHRFPSGAGIQQSTTRSGDGPPGEGPTAPPTSPPEADDGDSGEWRNPDAYL
ncbi:MAG: rane protein of unknown function [Candidatus Saccharibacteria bacterium]|nr:rane protein of unknown function [Candidatus Saccharibacteria bacterium]